MKTLLISILTLLTITLNAQLNTGIGIGWSSKQAAILDLHGGYQNTKNIFVRGGFLSHLSNHTDKGAVFYAIGGYNINLDDNWSLQPGLGYFYNLKTTDDKLQNTSGLIASVYLLRYFRKDGQFFLSTNLADKIFLTSFGVRWILIKK